MSKVAIVGDPSGTGTFTISAPNGNTDRTLVLPDEAGTVLLNGTTSIVTKPNQPSFLAATTGTIVGNGTVAGYETFVFNSKRHDVNGDYDHTTGVFTAPVTGSYLITWTLTPQSDSISARYFRSQLFKNGSVYLAPHHTISDETANGDYNDIGGTAVIYLTAGDELKVQFGCSVATNVFTFYPDQNWFSGYLLG